MWHFGINPDNIAGVLREDDWAEHEQVGRAEFALRYVQPLGRDRSVSEIERCGYAEKVWVGRCPGRKSSLRLHVTPNCGDAFLRADSSMTRSANHAC